MGTVKEVRVIGGVGDISWGTQYRQQDRVIDKKQVAYAVCAERVIEMVVKRYEDRNKTGN